MTHRCVCRHRDLFAVLVMLAMLVTSVAAAAPTDFARHLRAGFAAEKRAAWADSAREFAAAVELADDERAWVELGFVAMRAGDAMTARKADEHAIRIAVDPAHKAAALYNLGQLQADLGDRDAAIQSFTQSVALRPNPTVAAKLTMLTQDHDEPVCASGMSACDCIAKIDSSEFTSCTESTTIKVPVAGWRVFNAEGIGFARQFLVDSHNKAITIVADEEEAEPPPLERHLSGNMELLTIAGHRVLRVTVNELTAEHGKHTSASLVTLCAVDNRQTRLGCWIDAPALIENVDGSASRFDISVGNDGIVKVKLIKGRLDASLQHSVGARRLW
jgi:tetratricopeptide (TPR) repeat protein